MHCLKAREHRQGIELVEDSVRGPGLARMYRRTRPLMAGTRRPGKLNVDMWLVR